MKFRMIALAAMAVTGASQAAVISPATIAAGIANNTIEEVRIFGASAQSTFVGAYMKNNVCQGAADFTTYFDTTSGSNHRAYACTLAVASPGYPVGKIVFVNKREAGGSVYGVNPVALVAPQNTMVVDASCVSTGNTAPLSTQAAFTCATATAAPFNPANLKAPHAGISDVEPAQFGKVVTVNGASVNLNLPAGNDDNGTPWTVLSTAQVNAMDSAAINQTLFGVAVNLPLRDKLQAAQGLTVGSDAAADQPSMPRAFYTAAISGFVKGGSANANWRSLTGDAADAGKQVNICRRANGSGTQVTSNLFFADAGVLSSDALGMLFPKTTTQPAVNLAVTGTLAVIENASTGAVETCLADATVAAGSGYSMGVISLEKDPIATAKNYRFVKIDGAAPTKALARVGAYPFVYSATMQWKKTGVLSTSQKNFLTEMRRELGSPSVIDALTDVPTKNGVMANPNSYTTTNCAAATGVNLAHGSCVERLDFGSAFNAGSYINGAAKFKTSSNQPLHFVK